jgi:hypothetical protein
LPHGTARTAQFSDALSQQNYSAQDGVLRVQLPPLSSAILMQPKK